MTARRIRAIAGKDLRDAWRDGRVATLLVFPVLVGWSTAKLNGEVGPAPAGADAAAAITVVLTGLPLDSLPQFAAATAALIVTLVGFGLLLGLLVRNAGAGPNAYGGLLVVPVLGAAAAVFAADSGIMRTVLDLLPFSQSVRLLADGVSSRPVSDTGPIPWLVILTWALGGHAVLARVATRREL